MSFCEDYLTKVGDVIIVLLGYGVIKWIILKKKEYFNCIYGNYKHVDFIGKPWGSRIISNLNKKKRKLIQNQNYIYILKPTPYLWTLAVQHRTQILYFTDISMIIFRLGIKPGNTILESGTGTGSLSVHLIRSLHPTGHLYSFEFNQNRIKAVQIEFSSLHTNPFVTIIHRNICQEGFPLDRNCYAKGNRHGVDIIIIDLPNPIKSLSSCFEILNENCEICSFSPCIEQVQNTCKRLREIGFTNIETLETLSKDIEVKTQSFKPFSFSDFSENIVPTSSTKPYPSMFGHTGYLTFALKPPKLIK